MMNGISGNIRNILCLVTKVASNWIRFLLGAGSALMGLGAGLVIVLTVSGGLLGAIFGLICGVILAALGYACYEASLRTLQIRIEMKTGDQITEVVTSDEVN